MTDTKFLTVDIEVRGDSENSPEETLHHALAKLHDMGLILSWSEPVSESLCPFCGAHSPKQCGLWKEAGGFCPWEASE